ncbi:MAG: hypothetical protein H6704_14705 [Myxococcales bacterium]|nr:hypothetical protein [Myxococcales bacterium]
MNTRRTPRRSPGPVLEDASETCPDCLQTYAYALEVRCVVCDDPRCPFCVVTATLSTGAPHCRACARTEAS